MAVGVFLPSSALGFVMGSDSEHLIKVLMEAVLELVGMEVELK